MSSTEAEPPMRKRSRCVKFRCSLIGIIAHCSCAERIFLQHFDPEFAALQYLRAPTEQGHSRNMPSSRRRLFHVGYSALPALLALLAALQLAFGFDHHLHPVTSFATHEGPWGLEAAANLSRWRTGIFEGTMEAGNPQGHARYDAFKPVSAFMRCRSLVQCSRRVWCRRWGGQDTSSPVHE